MPIELGIFQEVESPSNLSVVDIVSRIHANEDRYKEKFERKIKLEQEYYDDRYKDVPKVSAPNTPVTGTEDITVEISVPSMQ